MVSFISLAFVIRILKCLKLKVSFPPHICQRKKIFVRSRSGWLSVPHTYPGSNLNIKFHYKYNYFTSFFFTRKHGGPMICYMNKKKEGKVEAHSNKREAGGALHPWYHSHPNHTRCTPIISFFSTINFKLLNFKCGL